ncbi:unnamed protein product [Lepeophtheirus salmonis]|uniref:(salmon louse) hypothetical protein n=1 Tax=Lepeophtheirus salmonis TaxID=72036 RepID=A0A7R8H4N9_LEPSM|nr:unnamed protein product [Lepeophtheirus salmonis]CAF2851764.1 unnamed protein product [Lepeophtheirus salmonis]
MHQIPLIVEYIDDNRMKSTVKLTPMESFDFVLDNKLKVLSTVNKNQSFCPGQNFLSGFQQLFLLIACCDEGGKSCWIGGLSLGIVELCVSIKIFQLFVQ